MKIRLGALEVRLSRYLALWSLVVVVFAMQGCVNDAVNARLWPPHSPICAGPACSG